METRVDRVKDLSNRLETQTKEIDQAGRQYLNADNPLFALMSTLVNRQQLDDR